MSYKLALSVDGHAHDAGKGFKQCVGLARVLVLLMLVAQLFLTTGCGTIAERGKPSSASRGDDYYIGTQYDWRLLTLEGTGTYDYIPMFCYLSVVCPFVILFSMPVDFVIDTAMLYGDHQKKVDRGR